MDALTLGATDLSRFDAFSIISVGYKTVSGHTITVDVLYPKSLNEPSQEQLLSVPRPVLLRYHGGGLIAGYSLFPPFFSPWYLELAQEHSAIIVSPNYRLLPESSVLEVLEDVEDHWQWLHQSLPILLQRETNGTVKADLSRIMTIGDSAGGYLCLQMGLNHPDEIRAVNAVYPLVNPKAPYFSSGQERPVFNLPAYPPDTLRLHLDNIKKQEAITQEPVIVSAAADADRFRLMFAACQHGQLGQLFREAPISPYLLERLKAGSRFPRGGVLILHGRDDSVAPVEESYLLQRTLAQVDPSLNFRLVVRDGEHGFDHLAKLHDDWLWDAIQDIVRSWLD
ncbi:probable carboxylesterase 120 [Aspergillus udagawae]|uniref:Probable carboxylesterase 120 n=1 Tax=Aspergillus udagawae TaxID=91492 RepID=A0ABQ1B7J1_9EURO|nr:probable carboxylesterase 120 [Aspergillus udagawae]GFF95403.1 probable carboxylesterase 120 [Aspergillus udagawae]